MHYTSGHGLTTIAICEQCTLESMHGSDKNGAPTAVKKQARLPARDMEGMTVGFR